MRSLYTTFYNSWKNKLVINCIFGYVVKLLYIGYIFYIGYSFNILIDLIYYFLEFWDQTNPDIEFKFFLELLQVRLNNGEKGFSSIPFMSTRGLNNSISKIRASFFPK